MIHVDDAITALLLLAHRPEAVAETYIATDGELHSTHEIYQKVCAALGCPASRWATPATCLRVAATVGDVLGRPIIDPLPELAAYDPETRRGFRFGKDVHLTPAGHLAVAKAIATRLASLLEPQ